MWNRPPRLPVRALAVAWAALAIAGCSAADIRDPQTPRDRAPIGARSWEALPTGPLTPREGALGLWTGREVLIIGGSDARPCPPSASCVPPDVPPLRDGAALDPETGEWRRIASAPVPFDHAQGTVIAGIAHVWIPGNPGRPGADSAFLAYSVSDDRWERLRLPPGDADRFAGIARAGVRIVAYSHSDEQGERPDFLFDPAGGSWRRLPRDPLSPSFDRSMAWSGRELVLFDHELVPNPGSERPSFTRAAALEIDTGVWRRLPDSEILGTGPWVLVDRRLVNPTLGGADGGEAGNWGRTYPYGGVLDPAAGEWSSLPDPPSGEEAVAAGVITGSHGHFFGHRGWVLDAGTSTWIQLPPLQSDALVTGRTVAAAGSRLLVFGGARWDSGGRQGTLLDTGSIW